MNQLELRQLLHRQDETIKRQNINLLSNAVEIEYLEDKLDSTIRRSRRTLHEISIVSGLCMFSSGAFAMNVFKAILNGEISKSVFYAVFSILAVLIGIGIRKSNWM